MSEALPPTQTSISGTTEESSRRRRVFFALVVALVVIAAASLGGYAFTHRSTGGKISVVNDGPNLYEALAAVNASASLQPGGPWILSQIYGVASPVPVDPTSWGYDEYDYVLASCQGAFNGLTLWNGTLPLFDGSYNSGTAPFWQIDYFSNASQQVLVGTDVNGTVHIFPPIAFTSECAETTGLGWEPWIWSQYWGQAGYPDNSPTIAANDWNGVAESYVNWLNRPIAEFYLFGATQFGSGQAGVDQVNFFTCGTLGGVGLTPGLAIYGGSSGYTPPGSFETWNYTLGCTPDSYNLTAIPIEMRFSTVTVATANDSSSIRSEFTLYNTGPLPLHGPGYNDRGITSWMLALNLTAAGGRSLPLAGSECASWVPTLSDCAANASGWYAVLLAPDGTWDGSYGASSGVGSWSDSVLPIANNETLAVIVPSSWNVTGDSLDVTSTTAQLPLNGTLAYS